jgi:hypothetical protein
MRTLYEDPLFAQVTARLFGSPQDCDARLEAIKLLLARDPDLSRYQSIGQTEDGDEIRVLKTQTLGAFHSVTVHFVVSQDNQSVTLRDIYNRPSPGAIPLPLQPLIPGPRSSVRPIKR